MNWKNKFKTPVMRVAPEPVRAAPQKVDVTKDHVEHITKSISKVNDEFNWRHADVILKGNDNER